MQAGVFLVFQTCLLLDRRYWKWNSYGELVETCFGMNRAAILALSIFPVALQMALCGEPRGKCLALQPWCIPGMSFPTINCVNSGCGVWEGAVVFSGYDREHLPVTWSHWSNDEHLVGALWLYCGCGWSFGRRITFISGVAVQGTLTRLTVQFKPLAARFPELFQEMSILWLGGQSVI